MLQLGDRIDDVLAVAAHGVGMFACVVGLMGGPRSLGDQRSNRLVVGIAGEHIELLVDLCQLGTQRFQASRVLRQTPMHQPGSHHHDARSWALVTVRPAPRRAATGHGGAPTTCRQDVPRVGFEPTLDGV